MFRVIMLCFVVVILAACAPTPAEDRPLPTLFILDTATPTLTPTLATATPAIRMLEYWVPASSTLLAEGVTDTWVFEGQQGDNISIRALGRGIDVTLTLLDPDGALIRTGETILTQLPKTGRYQLTAQAVSGTGDYDIGLAYSDRPNPNSSVPTLLPQVVGVPTPLPVTADLGRFITQLGDGQTVGESFANATESHVYIYEGTANDYVTVSMVRVSGDLDPRVTLYSPDGLPLATDSDSAGEVNAVLRSIRLPVDGFYTVQARSGSHTGAYALLIESNTQPVPVTPTLLAAPTVTPYAPVLAPTPDTVGNGALLRDHSPVVAQIEETGDVFTHTFDSQAGDIVTVRLQPAVDSPLIPRIEIINPEGVPIGAASGNTSPQNRTVSLANLQIEETGVHTLFVTGEGSTFGAYVVSFGFGTTAQTRLRGELLADRAVESVVDDFTTRDAWYMNLKRGDVIDASLTPLDSVTDTVLELVDSSGFLLGIDNRSSSTRAPQVSGVTIPSDGVYYLRIRAASPQGVGRYGLTLRYLDVAPPANLPRASVPLMRLQDSVLDSAYAFYPFYGRSGQRVRVRVIGAPASDFDAVAALLDPQAQVIGEGDDSNGTLNPDFIVTLPVDGTYNVRVNGYLKGGSFTLLVEELF